MQKKKDGIIHNQRQKIHPMRQIAIKDAGFEFHAGSKSYEYEYTFVYSRVYRTANGNIIGFVAFKSSLSCVIERCAKCQEHKGLYRSSPYSVYCNLLPLHYHS